MFGDGLAGVDHIGHVGFAVPGQRRRHADQDDVGFGQTGKIGRGVEAAAVAEGDDVGVGNVPDIRAPGLELRDLIGVKVEADHRNAAPPPGPHQRQPDIAQPDHPQRRRAGLQPGQAIFNQRYRRRRRKHRKATLK